MKVITSRPISAFGGLNFVHHQLDSLGIKQVLEASLPTLAPQSKYSWKDVFYSLLSIFYCGGDCIEDVKTILRDHFEYSQLFHLCSPDTLLRRLKTLSCSDDTCMTPRGTVHHQFNYNQLMTDLNIHLLQKLNVFDKEELILDYDNTIVYAEKQDCKMTYKREFGYQPGVCFIDEDTVLYVENRNGNCAAKAFQKETLTRMFDRLEANGVNRSYTFRADAASYQFEVIQLLEAKGCSFYIGVRNSYVEKYFSQITNWEKAKDQLGEEIWMGEIEIRPFEKRYRFGQTPPTYRLLVARKNKCDKQGNLFTQDCSEYKAVITNDQRLSVQEGMSFYNRRGAVERQFDVLKNDFGWNQVPFSHLAENTVFMYFTAMFRNLYKIIVNILSKKYVRVKKTHRMKRFIFSFISIPAKWIRKARQWYLRIYGTIQLRE